MDPSTIVAETILAKWDKGYKIVADIGSGRSLLPKRMGRRASLVYSIDPTHSNCGALNNVTYVSSTLEDLNLALLPRFDLITYSLVTQSIGTRCERRQVWERIAQMLKQSGTVIAVDLHPAGKTQSGIPWRKVRSLPSSYFSEEKVEAKVWYDDKCSSLVYSHLTFSELTESAFEAGFVLHAVEEFPRFVSGNELSTPAYLLSVWKKVGVPPSKDNTSVFI